MTAPATSTPMPSRTSGHAEIGSPASRAAIAEQGDQNDAGKQQHDTENSSDVTHKTLYQYEPSAKRAPP